MRFDLVDRVLEQSRDHIVTIKLVSMAEEYLQDHFPGFPVLHGVMMIEAMVQAGRRLLEGRAGAGLDPAPARPATRYVLGAVRALKYGRFVRPGDILRVQASVQKVLEDDCFELRAEAGVDGLAAGTTAPTIQIAAAGRIMLRPCRIPGHLPTHSPAHTHTRASTHGHTDARNGSPMHAEGAHQTPARQH